MKYYSILICLFSISIYASAQEEQKLIYPYAHKSAVTTNYFGTTVADPYRWLETDTSAALDWVQAENELTEKYMQKALTRYPLEYQLDANKYYSFGTLLRSGKYFFDFIRTDATSEAGLYIKKKIGSSNPELLVDPADYKKNKRDRVKVSDFEVSGDNKLIAVSLSTNGSDWQEIRVKTISPARDLNDVITGVKFSDIKWKDQGFFYCRYESLQKDKPLTSVLVNPCLYYHRLGTPQESDSLIFEYAGGSVTGTIHFDLLENERYLVVYHSAGKKLVQISFLDFQDKKQMQLKKLLRYSSEKQTFFSVLGMLDGKFILHTNKDADHGQVVSYNPVNGELNQLIPPYDAVLRQVNLIDGKLVCIYLDNIDNICIIFDRTGKVIKRLFYPTGSSVEGFEGTNNDSTTLFCYHSFLHPPIAYAFNMRTLKETLIEKTEVDYDPEMYEIQKVFYTSKDGTKIPMMIAGKKGLKRSGDTPTILYGYGGYGTSITPFFDIGFITHIRNGGLIALPCLRGGGEYGEEWHRKGMLENKQNVFDDFIAAAEYLIENKYTNKDRLALMGGSNGGLLVGAVLTQRPDLFKVAVCNVGVYDMLRYQYFTVGFASAREFGLSSDSVQFSYLYKYSPLQNVKAGVAYPATLIITADHDDRAVPMHSYKFAATLQEKSSGTAPILVYTQHKAGHYGNDAGNAKAYMYAFIYKNMDLKPREVRQGY